MAFTERCDKCKKMITDREGLWYRVDFVCESCYAIISGCYSNRERSRLIRKYNCLEEYNQARFKQEHFKILPFTEDAFLDEIKALDRNLAKLLK